MTVLLFLIYLMLALGLLPLTKNARNSELSHIQLSSLLLLQILMGVAVGMVTHELHSSKDYWSLHREGLEEYKLLTSHPKKFISSLLYSPYENPYGQYFNAVGSYWNDLRNNLLAKVLAICNVFSMRSYYINSLFFNCLCFFGHLSFFKLFHRLYPGKKYALILACFLIPSTLFYTSGIHKDLVVFSMLGIFCNNLNQSATERFNWKTYLNILCSFVVILLMRNFLAMLLIPFSVTYLITEKSKINALWSFSALIILLIGASWLSSVLSPQFNPATIIAERQHDFMQLRVAHSKIELTPLEPKFIGLIHNFPEALNHALLRPFPWEASSLFSMVLSAELWIFNVILLLFFTQRPHIFKNPRPIIVMGIGIAIGMFIISGYIIPNTNSLLRYKCIFLPLFLTPFLARLKWNLHRIKS